ncbi:arsenate reductase [Rhodovastum atsumiense]|uniref:Arsenate reductase n=1 Tax=Rhodovastum atsumiense TaxID=504468 RepID=A0A5M6IWI4_9PROT|nr:arsenate reductase (glutaredoxin) [Rhodovastum atsumiense]KAA5611755.1 arsenate reductase (glutaredoxin) [Rhodovastum atsumiense]CAH2604338.1 arsenate reductase [Rhodovastum atsumiense]
MSITIYHNPACGTSRNVLALIRNSGEEPRVVEYLRTPPTRDELVDLIRRMGIGARGLLREKGTPYAELGLGDPGRTEDELIDAMMRHPILINRPIVVTPLGVKLCRPSETVLDILPTPQQGAFSKEGGEQVVDARGRRVIPENPA